jgi:hypothetical protein
MTDIRLLRRGEAVDWNADNQSLLSATLMATPAQ